MRFLSQHHGNATCRPGFVLPGILIVILLLTMAVYSFSEQMINDLEFSVAQQQSIQRRCCIDSGVAYIAALSRTDDWNRDTQDDAERLFRNIPISESDKDWQFSIVVPRTVRDDLIRYGVVDESAKLDINHLAVDEEGAKVSRQRLLAIPGMTEQATDSILDWLDEDDEPRPNGAERNYYHSLGLEGMPDNGPFASLHRLSFVHGVSRSLVFAEDSNGDGWLDTNEDNGDESWPADNADGILQRGWSEFLTVRSGESTLREDGEHKINVNSDDLAELFDALVQEFDQDTALFVTALRLYGPANWQAPVQVTRQSIEDRIRYQLSEDGSEGSQEPRQTEKQNESRGGLNLGVEPAHVIGSLYELFGTTVRTKSASGKTILTSPWGDKDKVESISKHMPRLRDVLTTGPAEGIRGRVNINEAAVEILRGIPGISEEKLTLMVKERQSFVRSRGLSHTDATAWLLDRKVFTLPELWTMGPYITGRGNVLSATIVAYHSRTGPVARALVVVDGTKYPTRILKHADKSSLPGVFREQIK
ncbi:MAG TPA: hypothetical protein EYG03_08700 [Planctomycetes bacterium]|nr:hypothetical protein [Fuerstiella sp.]HIK92045.1 hypothetical protein [Planctomycetota bacterium]